jgi:hypothetical protein
MSKQVGSDMMTEKSKPEHLASTEQTSANHQLTSAMAGNCCSSIQSALLINVHCLSACTEWHSCHVHHVHHVQVLTHHLGGAPLTTGCLLHCSWMSGMEPDATDSAAAPPDGDTSCNKPACSALPLLLRMALQLVDPVAVATRRNSRPQDLPTVITCEGPMFRVLPPAKGQGC